MGEKLIHARNGKLKKKPVFCFLKKSLFLTHPILLLMYDLRRATDRLADFMECLYSIMYTHCRVKFETSVDNGTVAVE